MGMGEWAGKLMVLLGLVLMVVGGFIWLMARLGGGEMPGTLRIERPGFTCIIPILGSILLSVLLTVILNILARLLR